jgi:hypothetical protein
MEEKGEPGGVTLSREIRLKVVLSALMVVCAIFLSSCSAISEVTSGIESLTDGTELTADVPVDSDSRANPGQPRDNTPQVLMPEQPGIAVAGDGNAVVDYSNAASGYICAQSFLGDTKVKVLVNAPDGNQYQYTIASGGYYITIPLSRGSGNYQVGVYQNMYDDQYAALFSQDISVELADEFGAFLYPNQYVEFYPDDATVQLSQQVTANATSEVEAVEQIYLYVAKTISYDTAKAESVAPGYLPNNDNTLATDTGICFDFASLTASMMRAQRLPCKLDIGYCGQAYHAWIEVYTTDTGWVRKKIEFKGNAWTLMDPTFDSSNKGKGDISKIIGDGTNYQPMFYY